jgi:hypothetical protein
MGKPTRLLYVSLLALGLVGSVAVSAVGAQTGDEEDEPSIPCRDPAGCPDITVDPTRMNDQHIQTRTFSETSCSVREDHTEPGQRRLLRFTFTSPNVGDGDLIVGDPHDHPEWFDLETCHGHEHYEEYADYRLWEPDAYAKWNAYRAADPGATDEQILDEHPELRENFVLGQKMGFCVIDLRSYTGVGFPRYTSCADDQGISVGWADEYHWTLDGQWIDITGLAPGGYILEAEVNDDRFYEESDYTNNRAAVPAAVPP